MEDLSPVSDAEQATFCVELEKRQDMLRRNDHLCDLTLVTKDGKEFKAHRNVLSTASPFFSKLHQSNMKENQEGLVRFEEISGAVMEDVLEFIYTRSVEVTQENCKDLLAAANYLVIPGLKTLCGQFLERQMSESNCISTFCCAERYQCDELITITRKFIHANFASVAEMDEFLNLEAKEVERWISNDEISVAVEADVFNIVLKWIERNKSERKTSFEQLFRHVRLPFLSREFLFHVVTNELVEENVDCFKLISKAIKLSGLTSEENVLQVPRKGLETRAIVTCGGKYTFCYLPEKDEWKRLADGLTERNEDTQMINHRDQLYAFSYDGTVERYDPVFDCWCTLDPHLEWPNENSRIKVALVRGEFYSIEFDILSRKSTVKRFNIEQCSWQTVLSSHEGWRTGSCVVAADHHLYVCGGMLEGVFVAKVERFDTVVNKWEEIASMQQARGHAFGVATEGKIFVAGGMEDWQSRLKTCEMFNISTNEWQLIGSLKVPHQYGSLVCLKGTLYVLGGTNGFRRDLSVERYDPTEDKWIEKTTIPLKMISQDDEDLFTGCVLKLSQGVLDKLDVIS